jgi:hypothetical protein
LRPPKKREVRQRLSVIRGSGIQSGAEDVELDDEEDVVDDEDEDEEDMMLNHCMRGASSPLP